MVMLICISTLVMKTEMVIKSKYYEFLFMLGFLF